MKGKRQRVSKGSSRAKSKKIHSDEVKGRHTTHWDLDYWSLEQVDAAYEAGRTDNDDRERYGRRLGTGFPLTVVSTQVSRHIMESTIV